MRVSELLRLLADDGWAKVRTGKHIILRHPTKPGILRVPNHPAKEVAAGTLNSILKEAGLK